MNNTIKCRKNILRQLHYKSCDIHVVTFHRQFSMGSINSAESILHTKKHNYIE